ncbi:MAG: hypothetical protein LKE64_08165 [Solobacterium sp.]|jgi:Na+-driven multidrug efflux pump|nr:hypothetical protein [Solobacterium sp.]MCH4048797.1 hypothetical protein [Solobacterium sp.]MCH4074449.1 hypothetical protein [Solobacterium sp.]MCI1314039.1 MATE family efflux transporter [Solobacterium sp.]MCI1407896.1 MATE family efflux transporter [Solobacterium sp.]
MNAKMAAYGDMAVAGIGVAMKITMITGMVSMGIGQGVQPLLGYCTGARDWKRFRQYFRFSMIFATALGTGLTLLCYGGLNQLGGVGVFFHCQHIKTGYGIYSDAVCPGQSVWGGWSCMGAAGSRSCFICGWDCHVCSDLA